MARGTRVGQAYVALVADGDGLNEDIIEAFEDVDFDEMGNRHGKKYANNLRRHLQGLDKDFTASMKRMTKAFDTDSALIEGVQNRLARALGSGELDKLTREAGRRAGDKFGTSFDKELNRVVLESLEDILQKAARGGRLDLVLGREGKNGGQIDIAGPDMDRIVADVKRAWTAMEREQDAALRDMLKRQEQYLRDLDKAEVGADRERLASRKRHAAEVLQIAKNRIREEGLLQEEADRKAERAVIDLWKVRRTTAEAHTKYLAQLQRGQIDEFGNAIRRIGRGGPDRDFGSRIGRIFGAGSRNNFLNLLGRSMTGMIRSSQMFGRVLTGLPQLLTKFRVGMSTAGQGASVLARLMAGLGASGIGLTGSLATIGPVAGVVVIALAALVSVMGALLAVVTALASTIVSALVGALAVTGGMLTALVASAGLLTAAFMSMDDAQKAILKSSFKPLKAEMVGIAQLMLRDMVPAFAVWSENLQKALLLLAPVANVMGRAFANAGTALTAALSGPGFQKLAEALTVYLPNITEKMTSALGSFLNGLSGMFAAIMPQVSRFADYLAAVTARFSAWANSAEGQNAIVNFVDRAVDALLSLWGFVREFTGFISDVLFSPEAQNAGNTIFDSLTRAFEGFRASIADGSLEGWFEDAIYFAGVLGSVFTALADILGALYNSGILHGIGALLEGMGWIISNVLVPPLTLLVDLFGGIISAGLALPLAAFEALVQLFEWGARAGESLFGALSDIYSFAGELPILGPLGSLFNMLSRVADMASAAAGVIKTVLGLGGGGGGHLNLQGVVQGTIDRVRSQTLVDSGGLGSAAMAGSTVGGAQPFNISSLISSGSRSISRSGIGSGARSGARAGGRAGAKKYFNPYRKWALSLIKEGPSVRKEIQQAIRKVNRDIRRGINEVEKIEGRADARAAIRALSRSARDAAQATVDTARNALNSSARTLAGASSAADARRALAAVRRAQKNLRTAQRDQRRIQRAARLMDRQQRSHANRIKRLMAGGTAVNATLADYAAARLRVANKLERANQQLADAIAMKAEYRNTVTNAMREFGSILTAEAQIIDGVAQSLTANDITENLADRLARIKEFQSDLRELIALGLSNDAYKQLVDAGVDQGGAFADALLSGGVGAVTETNQLVEQINQTADQLGRQASNRMFNAGINAARGLVEGLESLSGQLDRAAGRLGTRIANAIAKRLGIKSPSTVLAAMMDDVGDGAVIGLRNQHTKVGNAAGALASQIAVSPEAARYTTEQRRAPVSDEGVSGNGSGQRFRDLVVHTPTEDPQAVAMEVLNEVTGRL